MTVVPTNLQSALADRYQVEREVGRGGMATVYLAQDVRHHRPGHQARTRVRARARATATRGGANRRRSTASINPACAGDDARVDDAN